MATVTLLLLIATLAVGADALRHGELRAELFDQHLSHLAFHSGVMKMELAAMVAESRVVAVVGVEWGREVQEFAERGYRVHAVEPLPQFVSYLSRLIEKNSKWDVRLSPIAAVAKRGMGNITLEYDNVEGSAIVQTGVLDDVVDADVQLDVLSVDIQGDELEVLLGATELLAGVSPRVRSMWIEVGACNEKVRRILQLLDERYVLFDFVPWGQPAAEPRAGVPRSRASFLAGPRPSNFQDYWMWMCDAQKRDYLWLQTDIVAVRRDLVTVEVLRKISELGAHVCGKGEIPANCVFRELMLQDLDIKTEL